MQHTKEPWFIPSEPISLRGKICAANNDSAIGMFVVTDANSNFPDSAKADSKRIVACVNALAGLSDDALSGGWNFKEMSARTKALEDLLLLCCKDLFSSTGKFKKKTALELTKYVRQFNLDGEI